MLRVQVIYESTAPLLLVLVVGIGKYTNTMSHRMCMTQYRISKRMSKSISQQNSMSQRATTRNSPKLISQR